MFFLAVAPVCWRRGNELLRAGKYKCNRHSIVEEDEDEEDGICWRKYRRPEDLLFPKGDDRREKKVPYVGKAAGT